MTTAVLTDEVAQVCAKPHIGCHTFLKIPPLNKKSSKTKESFPIDKILPKLFRQLGQIG